MTSARIQVGGLSVAEVLYRFIMDEALPGSMVDPDVFWAGAEALIDGLAPRNRKLLDRRDELQARIDAWHLDATNDQSAYIDFLQEIGYLADVPDDFHIATQGVDTEIATQAGPQLVVPLLNARFAINAANARWGSFYDACYGTDVIPEDGNLHRGERYNAARGEAVIARGRALLDDYFPLVGGSHAAATSYAIDPGGLVVSVSGEDLRLADRGQLVGFRGDPHSPGAIVLVHHDLHLEILIDRTNSIGALDAAGVRDIVLESALTAIMDLEDSVAAVDATDKVLGYRNWLGLMQGSLSQEMTKNGATFIRTMNPDRTCQTLAGEEIALQGRALMFIRQVGHLMTSDAVFDRSGNEVPEGILDALVTALGSVHDLRGDSVFANSRTGSIYVVKPKMHGPEEVEFTNDLFDEVERVLGLEPYTIKIGIMDEERRTTVNLKACIKAARNRIAFINTGFLDRTGDEIHTSMYAGPVVRKNDMRAEVWIRAYEDSNVDVGLSCGFYGRAQIGKGMWASPDRMADMLAKKIEHPRAGATCAWVPSPTAATLHATHYLAVDVHQRQRELLGANRTTLEELLTIPVGDPGSWSDIDRQHELDNNVQSALGYVVRWIDAGVGCSKVPDIHGEALMEDRATCRISSQHIANWMLHGVVTAAAVEETLRRMATVVDEQNSSDPTYIPMAPTFDGEAFCAAHDLIFEGLSQPSGYTEPILHRHRLVQKDLALRTVAR
jgi:malate synthase